MSVFVTVARLQATINRGGARLDRMKKPELRNTARVRADLVDLLKRHVERGTTTSMPLRGKIDDLKAELAVERAAAAAAAAAAPDEDLLELLESYAAVEEARLFLFLFSRLFSPFVPLPPYNSTHFLRALPPPP